MIFKNFIFSLSNIFIVNYIVEFELLLVISFKLFLSLLNGGNTIKSNFEIIYPK